MRKKQLHPWRTLPHSSPPRRPPFFPAIHTLERILGIDCIGPLHDTQLASNFNRYLETLHARHEEWLMGDLSHPDRLGVPVLVLDANVDDTDENIHAGFCQQIQQKLQELRRAEEAPAPLDGAGDATAAAPKDSDSKAYARPAPIPTTPPSKKSAGETTNRLLLTPSPNAGQVHAE